MSDIAITSNELIQKNKFELPQQAKDFGSCNFWYYTSLSTADAILQSKRIRISNFEKMNDLDESVLHEEDKKFVHCFCLCNSNSEKIPMWYLYSGITGRGVSIGFTPKILMKLISSIEELTHSDRKIVLKKGRDFDIEYGWIYYRKTSEKNKVKYRSNWYHLEDSNNFEKNNYFIKAYPWEYEREFRIIVHNKTNQPYDWLELDISPVFDKLKIKLAPELTEQKFKELLPNLSGFTDFFAQIAVKSNLGIRMNLMRRNYDNFLSYVEECSKMENGSPEKDNLSRICQSMQPACCANKKVEE